MHNVCTRSDAISLSSLHQDIRKSWKEGRGSHIDFITGSCIHDSAGFVTGTILGVERRNETNDYNKDNQEMFSYNYIWFRRYDNTDELLDVNIMRFVFTKTFTMPIHSLKIAWEITRRETNLFIITAISQRVRWYRGGTRYICSTVLASYLCLGWLDFVPPFITSARFLRPFSLESDLWT